MANLTAQAVWEEIYSIAEDDPVQGGDGGIDNIPHQQLANRTAFLKVEIDSAKGDIPDGENASLASLLQRIKALEGKPAPTLPEMPTIKQFMIPVGGLFETVKPYVTGGELATDMGYGTWERYGEGRMTLGLTTAPETDSAGGVGVFNQIGEKFGEYDHVLTVGEMPKHQHSPNGYFNKFAGRASDVRGRDLLIQQGKLQGSPWINNNVTPASLDNTDTPDELMVGGFNETAWSNTLETQQGNDQPHNNIPPVVVVGRWVRTA